MVTVDCFACFRKPGPIARFSRAGFITRHVRPFPGRITVAMRSRLWASAVVTCQAPALPLFPLPVSLGLFSPRLRCKHSQGIQPPQLLFLCRVEMGQLHPGHLKLLIVDRTATGEEHPFLSNLSRHLFKKSSRYVPDVPMTTLGQASSMRLASNSSMPLMLICPPLSATNCTSGNWDATSPI